MACSIYRLAIHVVIGLIGCDLIIWTPTNIELILNGLALTFILSLNSIMYKAVINRPRQNLVTKLKKFEFRDPSGMSRWFMNTGKIGMVILVIGITAMVTFGLRSFQ